MGGNAGQAPSFASLCESYAVVPPHLTFGKIVKKEITLGGKLSVLIAALWAFSNFAMWSGLPGGGFLSPIAIIFSYPLGFIDNAGGIYGRRGVVEVSEFLTLALLMIPNSFLLGYGIAGFYKGLIPIDVISASSSARITSKPMKTKKPNKNR